MTKVFKILEGEVSISVDGLLNIGVPVGTIKSALHRNTYRSYPDPEDARRRYIVVDSLPKHVHAGMINHYGCPYIYHASESWISMIDGMIDPADGVWFITQKLTEDHARKQARSCAWIRFTLSTINVELFDKSIGLSARWKSVIIVPKSRQ
jgi:hypothetical protein